MCPPLDVAAVSTRVISDEPIGWVTSMYKYKYKYSLETGSRHSRERAYHLSIFLGYSEASKQQDRHSFLRSTSKVGKVGFRCYVLPDSLIISCGSVAKGCYSIKNPHIRILQLPAQSSHSLHTLGMCSEWYAERNLYETSQDISPHFTVWA